MHKHLLALLFAMFFISNTVHALETGKVQYTVPIDYTFLDEESLSKQAEEFFQIYMETQDKKALQNMLTTYCILTNVNKENPLYFVRVGIAYDKLKNDRYAKSYFGQSMSIQHRYPYAYSAFGDYWFERCRYRKALANYLIANDFGYNSDYNNLVKTGTCFEKLGDYSSAINFYRKALQYKPEDEELANRIQLLENKLMENSLYNVQERRIQQ